MWVVRGDIYLPWKFQKLDSAPFLIKFINMWKCQNILFTFFITDIYREMKT